MEVRWRDVLMPPTVIARGASKDTSQSHSDGFRFSFRAHLQTLAEGETNMEREMEQGANVGRRAPASCVPEEHVITECYPVFPAHVVDYPRIPGQPDAQLNVSYLVNRTCRQVALSRSRVIGGQGRKGVPMDAGYFEIDCSLSAFAPQRSSSAYETLMAILDEYPRNDGTDHLRCVIEAIPVANCRACAAEFDVRLPHVCAQRDISRNERYLVKAYRTLDRTLASLPRRTSSNTD